MFHAVSRFFGALARRAAQLILAASAAAGLYLLIRDPAATIGYALVVAGIIALYLVVGMAISDLHDRHNPHLRRIVERERRLSDAEYDRRYPGDRRQRGVGRGEGEACGG